MAARGDIERNSPQSPPQPGDFAPAVAAMTAGRLAEAREMLEQLVLVDPGDPVAKRLLAEVLARAGQLDKAEGLLRQALEINPEFIDARINLALVLHSQNRFEDALTELQSIPAPAGDQYGVSARRASLLARLGRHAEAIDEYRALLDRVPDDRQLRLGLGHLLKAVGDRSGAIAQYRRALDLSPGFGAAWWALANLKTLTFADTDIAAIEAAAGSAGADDALRLHFALGKAFEDQGDDPAAFAHYDAGNRLRAAQLRYRPDKIDAIVDTSRDLFTRDFLDARAAAGSALAAPIFILGMPRSGSTLVEQILASHPLVEGLSELPYIDQLASRVEQESFRSGRAGRPYPEALADLPLERIGGLAEDYLERVKAHRRTDRPLFIDKMPNNWLHVGLIWTVLPNAKIIDVRRHPLACGFSNFKQHFAAGQEFAYDQQHFGHYYRSYVALMRHWDAVRPAGVHRLIYEGLVAEPEFEIRRMLDHLGLPFDPACLTAHATERAVATPSSEQVRQPISAATTDQWRRFGQWLGPMKSALGPTLEDWAD